MTKSSSPSPTDLQTPGRIARPTSAQAPDAAPKRPEIVLLHGMGCGGAVWAPMQASLSAEGWRCSAPTLLEKLRPDVAPARAKAPRLALSDYIADARGHCDDAYGRTGLRPIVIGHSMGGLLAQALVCQGACSRAILITPAPPAAIPHRSLWVPLLFANVLLSGRKDRYHKAWRFGVSRVLLNRVPASRHAEIHAAMRYEPGQVFADMMQGLALEPTSLTAPTLFVSTGHDRAVPPGLVSKTVDFYRTADHCVALRHYPAHGHWIIDEPGNKAFMADLLDWLQSPEQTNPKRRGTLDEPVDG